MKKMWWSFKWWLFILLWVLGLSLFFVWAVWENPVMSPLNSDSTFRFLGKSFPQSSTGKEVYGFLPYWNLDDYTWQPELTTVSYFSLTIGSNGALLTRTSEGGEPGFAKLSSDELADIIEQVKTKGQRFELTLTQFNNDDIYAFLNSQQAQENFLEELDAVLLAYPIGGLNIDIEYSGESPVALRADLVSFVSLVRDYLDAKYDHINLSISVYAGSHKEGSFWDLAALAPYLDQLVVMAYDFHQRGSIQAGPVAPIFGGKELWDSDISQNLQTIVKLIAKEKILLGVPFYGYEWQTTSREPQAHTFPHTGATASYRRVLEILEQQKELVVEEGWNEEALSPYISYLENGEIYVIYYENSRSLSYKLDLVNQLDLGGIAIWALGYEGNSRELWEVIDRKL